MKRLVKRLVNSVLIFLVLIMTIYSETIVWAGELTINISVDESNKTVTVSGHTTTGGEVVTVKIVDPDNNIDYLDQANAKDDGSYEFKYSVDGKENGTYTVYVYSEDVQNPLSRSFNLSIPQDLPDESSDDPDSSDDSDSSSPEETRPPVQSQPETKQPGTLQPEIKEPLPGQKEERQLEPIPINTIEAINRLDEIISSGNYERMPGVIEVFTDLLTKERRISVAIESLKTGLEKMSNVMNKIADEGYLKITSDELAKCIDTVANRIEKSSFSTVEKVKKLSDLKYETLGLILKVYDAASSSDNHIKIEENNTVKYDITGEEVTNIINEANQLSELYNSFRNISNQAIKNALQVAAQPIVINAKANGNQEIMVILESDAVEKIKADDNIKAILVSTSFGFINIPKDVLQDGKFEIQIVPKGTSENNNTTRNNISDIVDINLRINDKEIEKIGSKILLGLNLKQRPHDIYSIAAIRNIDGKEEVIPGIYVASTNQYIMERKTLGTYYIETYNMMFNDVMSDAWYYDDVRLAASKGIVSGYTDSTFRPNDYVTRAEFAKMIVQALQLDTIDTEISEFNDVKEDDWFYPYVTILHSLGIVNGRSGNIFVPYDPVTREEMAKITALAMEKANKVSSASVTQGAITFVDDSDISGWAKGYVAMVVENGIMQGTDRNKFGPKNKVTRAECAAVVIRALLK